MLVFCDFDGVLRRESAPKYQLEADLVANLAQFVADLESKGDIVEIVIASTWRTAFSLDELRSHFPIELRLKIVGTTPTLNLRQDIEHPRYLEIRAYLKKHNREGVEWLAIDDQATLFPPGLDRLLVCDPEQGFQGAKS